jgi:glucose-like phosphotransferase system IIB component
LAVKRKDVQDIVAAIGGKENVDTATHCVTRLRIVLKDDDKVDKDKLSENDLVKGQFKADNQYQIVIGPGTVDEVYKQFIEETGSSEASKDDAKAAAAQKGNALQRLIKLLGDIFIPILPAIVTAGLLLGINNLLTMENLFGPDPLVKQFPQLGDFSDIINVIANTAFTFLPVTFVFEHAGWLGGAIYGLFYAPLVITGLHHMFLAVDFQLMGSHLQGTYLWPIVAISNICQGSAAFGAWYVYKKGVTEPAMFGVNLPLKYPFLASIITSCVLGAIIGASGVLGKVGVGGVPAFISIQKEFWGVYLVCTLLAIIVPFVLTIILSRFSKEETKELVEE